MPTEAAKQALSVLRDPLYFQWYIIPIFVIVIYVYFAEVAKRNWSLALAGLAFWGMDWFNEIWNGLVFHFTQYAPVWGTPGKSAFVILIGLNIEISLMFAILGIACTQILPKDKSLKILGIPNRLFLAVVNSIICVIVEILLNLAGVLTWDYSWWNISAPWLIILLGYLPFFLVAYWVYDMESRKKQIITVSTILSFNAICLVIFGVILRWI